MTKEEKIAELINIRDNYNYTLAPREVFDDAIKSLEQTDVLDKIRAEIEDLTYYCWEVSPRTVIDDVLEIIDKHKAESDKESE